MIKCPECKEEIKLISHKRKTYVYTSGRKEHAVFECESCGHKEVFR
jgi:uncharacterized protein with PIN domain